MSADRSAASDGEPGVSRTQHLGAGWQSHRSVALHVCFLTGVPRRRRPGCCPPFCAPILLRRTAASDGGGWRFPGPPSRKPIGHCASRSRSPSSPLPGRFGHASPAMLIDRSGPRIGREQRWGLVGDRPPPFADDPTPITPVNSTH